MLRLLAAQCVCHLQFLVGGGTAGGRRLARAAQVTQVNVIAIGGLSCPPPAPLRDRTPTSDPFNTPLHTHRERSATHTRTSSMPITPRTHANVVYAHYTPHTRERRLCPLHPARTHARTHARGHTPHARGHTPHARTMRNTKNALRDIESVTFT